MLCVVADKVEGEFAVANIAGRLLLNATDYLLERGIDGLFDSLSDSSGFCARSLV